jgi:hypothetical protein
VTGDRLWRFWFTLPIYPYSQRQTIRSTIVPDRLWTFDQIQGVFYVIVPIRMTVVRLDGGGLLVYAPVAPTVECLRLLNELVAIHGEVKYIIAPTISGLEHNVFVGPFARAFPQAQIWVAPNRWSFPINLPLSWLGLPRGRTFILPADSSKVPFAAEFDYEILGGLSISVGYFGEVAFYHRQLRTLLVTDAIVSVPEQPPEIVNNDAFALLFHARDRATDEIIDTPAARQIGWQRICLFALFFQPSGLEIRTWGDTFKFARAVGDRSRQNFWGLYPFAWRSNWQKSFDALASNGRIFVAPILQTLILSRATQETLNWVDRVGRWDFDRIIPAHFAAPVAATATEFRQAFDFLKHPDADRSGLLAEDFQTLRDIDTRLDNLGILPPIDR